MSAALAVTAVGMTIRPPCSLVGRSVARCLSRLSPPLYTRPRPRVRCPPPFSEPSSSSSSSSSSQANPASGDDSERLPFEPAKKQRRRRAKDLAPPSPTEQVAQSNDPTSVYETLYVQFLSLYFLGLLVDGVLISASGFLPEAADVFIENYLYSSFSGAIGLFLVFSSAYGAYKYLSGK